MKEHEGLLNYLSNIILRSHRQVYEIQKLGPTKIVLKSNEKSLSLLQSFKNLKYIPKQYQQNYCDLIEVQRKDLTILSKGKNIQLSIYEPQLTNKQYKTPIDPQKSKQHPQKTLKAYFPNQIKPKFKNSYENCVVLLHANSASRLQASQYVKNVLQYRTLCVSFDYAGSGISEGQYTTMGVNQSEDLSNVINHISLNYQVKNFALWGRSMGAATAIYYLITKYKDDVNKIKVISCVIDSPFCNLQKLVLQLASQKTSLPQFVFLPLLKLLENEIMSKVGVNIFTELNLIQKIKNLTPQQTKLINSISFLGLASKQDKMINHNHCQELLSLLISRGIRSSIMSEQRNYMANMSSDKHLKMLIDFKSQINLKGDMIYIEGDHNKPRSYETKEKISFFIVQNFQNLKNQFSQQLISFEQSEKSILFSKTEANIKAKLFFTKSGIKELTNQKKDQNCNKGIFNQLNSRKESNSRHNYNFLNMNQMKIKVSLSKEKQNFSNILTKTQKIVQNKETVNYSRPNQDLTGPSIISKELQQDRIKNIQQKLKVPQKLSHSLQSQKINLILSQNKKLSNPTQSQKNSCKISPNKLKNLLNKAKESYKSYKYRQNKFENEKIKEQENNSSKESLVYDSIKKDESTKYPEFYREKTVKTDSESQSNEIHVNLKTALTLKKDYPRMEFASFQSQKLSRNNSTQKYLNFESLHFAPLKTPKPSQFSIETNMKSIINGDNLIDERFRKKQTSQILKSENKTIRKSGMEQIPKNSYGKVSISQFKSRYEETNKNFIGKEHRLSNKQMNLKQCNNNIIDIKGIQRAQSLEPEQKSSNRNSTQSIQSIQFRKRQPTTCNSIRKSDYSYESKMDEDKLKNNTLKENRRQRTVTTNPVVDYRGQKKHQIFLNSFSENKLSLNQAIKGHDKREKIQSTNLISNNDCHTFFHSATVCSGLSNKQRPMSIEDSDEQFQNTQYTFPSADKYFFPSYEFQKKSKQPTTMIRSLRTSENQADLSGRSRDNSFSGQLNSNKMQYNKEKKSSNLGSFCCGPSLHSIENSSYWCEQEYVSERDQQNKRIES